MRLIVGLGNPGDKYKDTRHNVGWQLADYLHEAWSFVDWDEKKKFKSHIAKGTVGDASVTLVKPQTFMNNSGDAVEALASYFDISSENIWVIQDELDLSFGNFKIQADRGSASHNGIESIMNKLGTKNFNRIRIGISPTADKRPQDSHYFVLKRFSFFERRKRSKLFEEIKISLEQKLSS